MSDPAPAFALLQRAHACLANPDVAWPSGIYTAPGLTSRSVQLYVRLWSIQQALALEIAQVSARPRHRWFASTLPVRRWHRCTHLLQRAQQHAQRHALQCGHKHVLPALSASLLSLAGMRRQLERLEASAQA